MYYYTEGYITTLPLLLTTATSLLRLVGTDRGRPELLKPPLGRVPLARPRCLPGESEVIVIVIV